MCVVPSTQETKVRESQFEANLDKDKHENLSEIQTKESKRIRV
jgi:hypothetical protein